MRAEVLSAGEQIADSAERRAGSALVALHYLPSLEYVAGLLKYEYIYIEAQEHYQKQSYRNRCYVRSANKVAALSIPVLEGNRKIRIRDVKIDYQQRWLTDHWRTIVSAYGKAPFFEYYAPYFEQILFSRHAYLFELNWELLTKCLALLKIRKSLVPTSSYIESAEWSGIDLRAVIHPKKNYLANKIYWGVPYVQNFGSDFVPNLSIIDLLFCKGPESRQWLEQSIVKS